MSYIAWQLRKRGFKTHSYSYQTVKKSVPDEAKRLIEEIKNLQSDTPLFWVGHSMGAVSYTHLTLPTSDLV